MDERFAQVLTDPRFSTLKRNERKVRIDGRFNQMFTDKRFSSKSDVDPRRGKVSQEEEHEEDHSLKSYYDTSDPTLVATSSRYDVRGNARDDDALSSSSDESSDEDEFQVDHDWAELDKDVPRNSETSNRLAVCNVDWDRIKAQDLFVLFNSFKPAASCILSVVIYPSEFGKKRMAEESVRGPTEMVDTTTVPIVDDDEHEAGDALENEYMQEKLRQYQLNRLKYYYAIIECDSQSTAESLYEQLDNYEFESSASTLDLRFVPHGETFDEEPEQVCKSLPDFATYKPPIFITSALQQSSVRLTWDETDPFRAQKIESAFASKDEKQLDDLQAFLASEEESDSAPEPERQSLSVGEDVPIPNKLNKYKMLLQAVEEENKNEEADIEITFDNHDSDDEHADQEPGRSSKRDDEDDASSDSNNESADERSETSDSSDQEEDANAPVTDPGDGDALQLLVEDEKSHFNFSDFLVGSKKGAKRIVDQDFEFDENDGRFGRIFSSAEYNIDPSNPHFRKTPAMMSLIHRKAQLVSQNRSDKKRKSESAVAGLVANIKHNTDNFVKQRNRNH